jgi:hypothetical protein
VSTVALGATAGLTDNLSDIWVKVTHDVDNGAGGNDVKFYYSTDGVAWTQLGTTVTTAGTVTRFGSTESHRVGAYAGTSNPWNGRIYSAHVLIGIGGAAVLNPDFTAWTVGQTSKADAIGNTWTLTGCFVVPASSITGDLDVRVKCRAVDWTPASAMYLVSHAVDATHFGWGLRLLATSAPDFVFTVDGSTFIQHLCTASLPGVVDNVTDIWIKVTFDADDGLGNAVTKFYTSSDGSTWTQLGSTVTDAAGPYVLYSPAATGMKVGAYTSAGLGGWNGYIYKAEIRNGIAGTVVANPDFTDYIWGTGDTVNNDAKGNAWTLTNAKIIAYETDVNCDQPNEWEYPVLVPTGSEPTNLNGSY